MAFIIAQITDFHITRPGELVAGRVDTRAYLERCVEQLARLDTPPDIVLATGDCVNEGSPDEYALLRELLAPLTMPVYFIPGNHDERNAMRAAFPDHAYLPREGRFVQYAVDDHPVRLVALDTVIAGEAGGELCGERLAWLAATLARAPRKPTIVMMHHPPFRTGIDFMDEIGLARGSDELGAIIEANAQVERIVCGHLHRSIQVRWHGTLASTCPSSAHQIPLSLKSRAPEGWILEPPGFQLHVWDGAALVSHTGVVGEFGGIHAFDD